jgi:hypothetical protein
MITWYHVVYLVHIFDVFWTYSSLCHQFYNRALDSRAAHHVAYCRLPWQTIVSRFVSFFVSLNLSFYLLVCPILTPNSYRGNILKYGNYHSQPPKPLRLSQQTNNVLFKTHTLTADSLPSSFRSSNFMT